MNDSCPHISADSCDFLPVFSNGDRRVNGSYKAGLVWVVWATDGEAPCPLFTVLF